MLKIMDANSLVIIMTNCSNRVRMVTSPSIRTVSNVDTTEYGVLISNIHVDTGADTSLV